ncbi:5974_t:CDS:1, partial [Dentiscutata erythropus]
MKKNLPDIRKVNKSVSDITLVLKIDTQVDEIVLTTMSFVKPIQQHLLKLPK